MFRNYPVLSVLIETHTEKSGITKARELLPHPMMGSYITSLRFKLEVLYLYGGFHKWRCPKVWMVYNEKSC